MLRFRKAAKKAVSATEIYDLKQEKAELSKSLQIAYEDNQKKDDEIQKLHETIKQLEYALNKAQIENDAAVKIQSVWRGHEVRQDMTKEEPVELIRSKSTKKQKQRRKRSKSQQQNAENELEKQLQTQLDQNKKLNEKMDKMTQIIERQTREIKRKTLQFKKEKLSLKQDDVELKRQNTEFINVCEDLRGKMDKLKSDNRMYQRDIYDLTQKTDTLSEALVKQSYLQNGAGNNNEDENVERNAEEQTLGTNDDERLQEYVRSYQQQIQQLNEHAMEWKNYALEMEQRLATLERECERDIGRLNALLIKNENRHRNTGKLKLGQNVNVNYDPLAIVNIPMEKTNNIKKKKRKKRNKKRGFAF